MRLDAVQTRLSERDVEDRSGRFRCDPAAPHVLVKDIPQLGANDLSDNFTMSQIDYVICQQYDATQSTTKGQAIYLVRASRVSF